jgi:hypothetical protein
LVNVQTLAEIVAAIQPLTAYLSVAMAVLPANHEWVQQAKRLQNEQLVLLRSGFMVQSSEFMVQSSKLETNNPELGTQNPEPRTRNPEPGTRTFTPKAGSRSGAVKGRVYSALPEYASPGPLNSRRR